MSDAQLRDLERDLAAHPTPAARDRLAAERARRGDGPWLPVPVAQISAFREWFVTQFPDRSWELRDGVLHEIHPPNTPIFPDDEQSYATIAYWLQRAFLDDSLTMFVQPDGGVRVVRADIVSVPDPE